jgi:putative ATP-dependent endonuclease of OLD family
MRICFLRIENFRGIKKAEIPVPPHCAFLGPNNCGKTTIANALAMLFGRDRWYPNISEHDFYGGDPGPNSRFNIVGTLTALHPTINDPTEFPEWFNTECGARVAWWHESRQRVSYETEPPIGAQLAVEVGLSGRYDDGICEFELRRYFYDGETDPFTLDPFVPFPSRLLSKVGFFLIPGLRHWDRLLSFGSGQFLKLLREIGGLPAEEINAFKDEMRNPDTKIEDADPLRELLKELEGDLRGFMLLPGSSRVIYRSTQLSVRSVLESLVPHVENQDGTVLPFSRQGEGFVSMQLLLLMLQFAVTRKKLCENTIFVAEEPELHLQPSLQRRLINRLRAYSNQTIVTTHSQHVASMFKPSEVVHLTNNAGTLKPEIVYAANIRASELPNQARQLYLRERTNFYEALLGQYLLVPEGQWDWQWLRLWIRVAEATAAEEQRPESVQPDWSLSALEIVRTNDSAVTAFVKELRRFRNDVFAIVDGDAEGRNKLQAISQMDESSRPKAVLQYGPGGEIEDVAAWAMEPALGSPGPILAGVLAQVQKPWTTQVLGQQLKLCERGGQRHKEDWELHENLAWEAYGYAECRARIVAFLSDIARICVGVDPKLSGWLPSTLPANNVPLHVASFIRNSAL